MLSVQGIVQDTKLAAFDPTCAQQCVILVVMVAGINCGSQWKVGFCFHIKCWQTVEKLGGEVQLVESNFKVKCVL